MNGPVLTGIQLEASRRKTGGAEKASLLGLFGRISFPKRASLKIIQFKNHLIVNRNDRAGIRHRAARDVFRAVNLIRVEVRTTRLFTVRGYSRLIEGGH